jgi:hypothetical protein
MSFITGVLKLALKTPYVGNVIFRPLSTPEQVEDDVILTQDVTVTTNSSGIFSVELVSGYYGIYAGASRRFAIFVRDDDLTWNIKDLIVTPFIYVGGPGTGGSTAPSGNAAVYLCETLADLQAITGTAGTKVAWLVGRAAAGDITPKCYRYAYSSTTAEDLVDLTVIAPSVGVGRWLQMF